MGLACCHRESSHPPIPWQSIPNPSGVPPPVSWAGEYLPPDSISYTFFSPFPKEKKDYFWLRSSPPRLYWVSWSQKIPSRKKKGVYEEVKMNGSHWNNPSEIVLKILFIAAFKAYIVTGLRNSFTPATLCTFTASLGFKCGHIIKSGDFNVTFFYCLCLLNNSFPCLVLQHQNGIPSITKFSMDHF